MASLLRGTVIGDVWAVETGELVKHPEIAQSGLPVFHVREVPRLKGRSLEGLKLIAIVKTEFPTAVLREGPLPGVSAEIDGEGVRWTTAYNHGEVDGEKRGWFDNDRPGIHAEGYGPDQPGEGEAP